MQSPLLTTPAQHAYQNHAVELDEKQIKKWVGEIPSLEVHDAIDALFNAIKPLNEHEISNDLRLNLLDIYREPVLQVLDKMELDKLRQLPINDQDKQFLIEDISFLLAEMASGYKVVVKNDCIAGKDPARDSRHLLSVYRAMEMLCQSLLYCYSVYREPPPYSYLEIHQLFQYVERHHALNTRIEDGNRSIRDLYLQTMLFAVSDPYHMAEGDARTMYGYLKHYTAICELKPQPTVVEEDIGLFTIDLAGDNPPKAVAKNRTYRRNPDFRIIDVRPVLATMLQQVKKKQNGENPMEEKAFGRLVSNLTAVKHNREPRFKRRRKVQTSFGLENIIEHIRYVQARDTAMLQALESAGQAEHDETLGENPLTEETSPGFAQHWVIANESKGGYLMFFPDEINFEVKPGECICINMAPQEKNGLIVAAIRWMKQQKDNQTQIGVEIIHRNPKIITVRGDNTAAFEGLSVLYDMEPAVITPVDTVLHGTATLAGDEQESKVRFLQPVMNTALFSIWSYEPVE